MKVTFFCKVDREALKVVEFYNQDIEILKNFGCDLVIATKYKEIDWTSNIIFVWWWTYAFYPVFLAKLRKRKVVITGTFNYRAPAAPIDFFRRPFWQRILIKYSITNADANILVSEAEYKLIKEEWKLMNIYYSPHVIDLNKYAYSDNRKEKIIFSIIWTGLKNLERKCLPEIIEVARLVRMRYPDYKFIIAGRRGDGFEYAEELVAHAGLEDTVVLTGEITEEDKIKYLQTCAIYLQPSKYEGFGVAIAEAMACGAPVISTNSGEVANVVGDSGILVKNCDPESVNNELCRLLSDPGQRKLLAIRARNRIEKYFHVGRRTNDIKQILEKLV